MIRLFRIASVLLLSSALPAHAAPAVDTDYIGDLLFEARSARQLFPDVMRINPSLDEPTLYRIQKRYIDRRLGDGAAIGGFKGGFIPRAPVGGVLFSAGIKRDQAVISSSNWHALLVEAEIAFQFCEPVTGPLDLAALKRIVCAVYPAVELPDASVPAFEALRANFEHLRSLLIPINVSAEGLLLGDAASASDINLNQLDVRVNYNGEQIGFRDGKSATGDIWERVLWVVNEFTLANGYSLHKGHVVIPGSLTGIHAGKPGQYEIDYGALGRITFRVD